MKKIARTLFPIATALAVLAAPAGNPAAGVGSASRGYVRPGHARTCLLLESRNALSVVAAPAQLTGTPEFLAACDVLHQKAAWLPESEIRSLADRICRLSRAKGIDPALLLAIIQTESNFRPTATSAAGAIGLMQLLPSTARVLASELQIAWHGESTLRDPHLNLEMGTHYFQKLLDRYDGNATLALIAYNAGPARVDASLHQGLPLSRAYPDKVQVYRDRMRGAFKPRAQKSAIPR